MATLLYRLGKTAYRRWPIFLAAWIIAMVGVGAFAATMSKPMTDAFSIPGIPSERRLTSRPSCSPAPSTPSTRPT